MTIACPTDSVHLSIELGAFGASSAVITQFTLYACSVTWQPDYSFLNSLTSLTDIYIQEAVNVPRFLKLPPYLPNLMSLMFRSCPSGLGSLTSNLNRLTYPKLLRLDLYDNNLVDSSINSILSAIYLNSTTLSSINVSSNHLTGIPPMVQSAYFPSLTQLFLHENSIKSATGNLSVGAVTPFSYLTLYSNQLSSISIHFQGNCNGLKRQFFDF